MGQTMSDLLLYHAVPSRSMIVHWMLEEVGEPYEVKLLDLPSEEHKSPEYLAINPMGKVPALVHEGRMVTESAAICTYLADAFPAAELSVPLTSPMRGEYLRWLFFATVTAEPAIIWRAMGDALPEMAYQPFADVDAVAATLAAAIGDREFIVGNRFTTADVLIGSTIMWGLRLMPVLPALPELVAYWERLEQRPAWQRAQAADTKLMADPG